MCYLGVETTGIFIESNGAVSDHLSDGIFTDSDVFFQAVQALCNEHVVQGLELGEQGLKLMSSFQAADLEKMGSCCLSVEMSARISGIRSHLSLGSVEL